MLDLIFLWLQILGEISKFTRTTCTATATLRRIEQPWAHRRPHAPGAGRDDKCDRVHKRGRWCGPATQALACTNIATCCSFIVQLATYYYSTPQQGGNLPARAGAMALRRVDRVPAHDTLPCAPCATGPTADASAPADKGGGGGKFETGAPARAPSAPPTALHMQTLNV